MALFDGNGTVTTAGTPVQVESSHNLVAWLDIQAHYDNVGRIWIGDWNLDPMDETL